MLSLMHGQLFLIWEMLHLEEPVSPLTRLAIVVQGMMPICFMSEFMTRRFGEGWFAGGWMSVNLVNVLWGADGGVACHGRVREYTVEGARRRAHCDVWAEKADGTKIIVGTASAVVA